MSETATARKRRRDWRSAVIAFVLANAVNAVLVAAWISLGWGLRGSAYEPGRPTAEDIWSVRILYGLAAIAFGVNVLAPVGFAIRRKWRIALAIVAAWLTVPLVYVFGLGFMVVVMRMMR